MSKSLANDKDTMSDAELCAFLGIAPATMQRWLREGPPRRKAIRGGRIFDLRTVERIHVGQSRRWVRSSLLHALGATE